MTLVGWLRLHPPFLGDALQPIMYGGNESGEIFPNMLFTDHTDWDFFTSRVDDDRAKQSFRLEDPVRMVSQGTMAKRRFEFLGSIEPIVDGDVVLGDTAEAFCG